MAIKIYLSELLGNKKMTQAELAERLVLDLTRLMKYIGKWWIESV